MQIDERHHLTYCTNIHPGETWQAVFNSLERYTLPVKQQLSPDAPFGIGLRLSNKASMELGAGKNLEHFRDWLASHDLYVFTMNGFPYGGFHRTVVKDQVHQPDWTTRDRVAYTLRLFNLLGTLLPAGMEGGISTSPLSYRPWHNSGPAVETAMIRAAGHLLEVIEYLHNHEEQTGQYLHLDLEPEPDGLLSTSAQTIAFFETWLLPMGQQFFAGRLAPAEAEAAIRRHLNVCYDICHFAVEYETPEAALAAFHRAGIRIGKVQISAALKADLTQNPADRQKIKRQFGVFNESTYLHQVVARDGEGHLHHFPDLDKALPHFDDLRWIEWRTHFHVPLFVDHYHHLQATRDDLLKTLAFLRREPVTRQLEVETYTWEVLPKSLQTDLVASIARELTWVTDHL